jgi:hypothetical protein
MPRITSDPGQTTGRKVRSLAIRESWEKENEMNEQDTDRKELDCERCGEWPCICGDRDFEAANIAELNKAEERVA